MKKVVGILLGVATCCGALGGGVITKAKAENPMRYTQAAGEKPQASGLQTRGKAAFLMDFATQTVLHSENELAHLPIASMCKIMTLLLSFEAIEAGNLQLDEEICISERAASMGGSQVFLEANAKYPAQELLKSIVVCSANDSCVAMAERVAGSEELFIDKMNEKAKDLGANDTLFANCTGLPKEPQYSCAKDVALMLRALLAHEKYYEFGKVWMDKFSHPEGRYTEITNTNKLVRFYDGCDGGKTGFTNQAGFCLAATAKRGDMRVISVVIGEENSKNRFDDVKTMFDYAFANYTNAPILQAGTLLDQQVTIQDGKKAQVCVYPERSAYAFTKRGAKPNVTVEIRLPSVKAPVAKGAKVGELLLFQDGVEMDRIALLTSESVGKANFFDRLQKIAEKWNG